MASTVSCIAPCRPFHPERFHAWASRPLANVIRSKGFFWLATRMPWVGEWSQAGGIRKVDQMGNWWADTAKAEWPSAPASLNTIQLKWHEPYGDRRQELVFIGTGGMDRAAITAQLNACLLTDDEFVEGPRRWSAYADPLPSWE